MKMGLFVPIDGKRIVAGAFDWRVALAAWNWLIGVALCFALLRCGLVWQGVVNRSHHGEDVRAGCGAAAAGDAECKRYEWR
jgi:hypothetical protein